MYTKMLLIIMAVFMTGCWEKEPKVYTRTMYLDTKPPKELLANDIKIPAPPNKENYILASPINRERMLTRQNIMLYGVIGKYKSRFNSIITYHKDMSITIREANKKEEERIKKLLEE